MEREVFRKSGVEVMNGDCMEFMKSLEDGAVQCVVTSPPYWGLRDYQVSGQFGMEATPELYVKNLKNVFKEVLRVMKKDGVLFLNIGDTYMSSGGSKRHMGGEDRKYRGRNIAFVEPQASRHQNIKPKEAVGIPWMTAFSLREIGFYIRQEIIWHKTDCMPESVNDRFTRAHETIFLLTKSPNYYFDYKAVMELANYDGRKKQMVKRAIKYNGEGYLPSKAHSIHKGFSNRWVDFDEVGRPLRRKRSVWTMATARTKENHFATFPKELAEICIKAGSRVGDVVFDPFLGCGTTAMVAHELGRKCMGSELSPDYFELLSKNISQSMEKEAVLV